MPNWINTRLHWLLWSVAVVSLLAGAALFLEARNQPRESATIAPTPAKLTGYWQNYADPRTGNLRLRDVAPEYDVVIVAFASHDPARRGAIRFSVDRYLTEALPGYDDDALIADVRTLRDNGRTVLLSVGGASDDVKITDDASAANFAESTQKIIARFGFDGVDIDLEKGISPAPLATALRSLNEKNPAMLITLTPQTLDLQPGGDYLTLLTEVKDIVTTVHTQYYNSGSMLGCDGKPYEQGTVDFVTAQACVLLDLLRPDQVSLGFPATPASATGGYLEPAAVERAWRCLGQSIECGTYRPKAAIRGLGGVMTWSINADSSTDYSFARAVRPVLDGA